MLGFWGLRGPGRRLLLLEAPCCKPRQATIPLAFPAVVPKVVPVIQGKLAAPFCRGAPGIAQLRPIDAARQCNNGSTHSAKTSRDVSPRGIRRGRDRHRQPGRGARPDAALQLFPGGGPPVHPMWIHQKAHSLFPDPPDRAELESALGTGLVLAPGQDRVRTVISAGVAARA